MATADRAPDDPRSAWGLPPLGALAARETVDELTTRFLAPNPSPMTLDGTNTYVVSAAGSGMAIIVDPGPDEPAHWGAVADELAAQDATVVAVFVTHHHVDHAAGAVAWSQRFGCPIVAADEAVTTSVGRRVGDGARLDLPGTSGCQVVATPGHTRDHLALRLPTGALLTGDHILGRGTTVVTHPDGDMAAYVTSLRRVRRLGPDALLPGHGPVLTQDPDAVIAFYEAHRSYREAQILQALADWPATVEQLVAVIYPDVDERLTAPAAASTRATLAVLEARGCVRRRNAAAPDGPYELAGRRTG
ncbi:MAG: MBL fold metallo-hydrolase [Nitriliruptoraceae bacterium]